jgi:hypothetical protein
VNAKQVLLRVGQLALIVLVTWGIIRTLAPDLTRVSLEDFARYRPSSIRIIIALTLLVVFYLLHAFCWRGLTMALGQQRFSFRRALYIYFVSGLGRYIPGKVWQLAGMALLAQRGGISPIAATAASLLAQFAFITTGLIYLAVVFPSWGGTAPIIIAVAALVLVAASYPLRHWAAVKVKRLRPAIDMLDRLTFSVALKWWLAYGLSWIVLGFAFVLFTGAFVALDVAQQRQVAGAFAAAYLGGLLAFFSIAGLGVREALLGSLLVSVMSPAAALVVSVASRLWFMVGEVLPLALIPALRDARSSHHSDV